MQVTLTIDFTNDVDQASADKAVFDLLRYTPDHKFEILGVRRLCVDARPEPLFIKD